MFKYLIIITFIAANAVQAQHVKSPSGSFSGMVIYKAQVAMRGKPTIDTLRFNRQGSFFQWERKMLKKTTTVKNNGVPKKYVDFVPPPDSIGSYVIYNAEKDSMFSRRRTREMATAGSQGIFVKEQTPHIHWSITDSTQKIGDYTVTKATAHFRGYNYTVWFTPKISVPYGPWKLVGLPGLILQAHDSSNNIVFNVQKITFKNNITIGAPSLTGKETTLNLAQYKKWMAHREKRLKQKMKAKILSHQQAMAAKQGQSASGVTVSVSISKPMEIFTDRTNQ